jgi:hypothetical protein
VTPESLKDRRLIRKVLVDVKILGVGGVLEGALGVRAQLLEDGEGEDRGRRQGP